VKPTSAKLIGAAYQNVPFTVIAWPISAAQPIAGLIHPCALPTLFERHFSLCVVTY
jgi:hypothetical protein